MKKIAHILVLVGGLNWLLVGLFGNDLGSWFLGGMDSILSRIVYILVGLSAVLLIVKMKDCNTKSTSVTKEVKIEEVPSMDSEM